MNKKENKEVVPEVDLGPCHASMVELSEKIVNGFLHMFDNSQFPIRQ